VKIMGIDPSINHTGWGCIDTSNSNGELVHMNSGVIIPANWEATGNERYRRIAVELFRIMTLPVPDLVVVEWPTFEESARGRDLVKKKGLTKLCAVAGGCVAVAAVHGISYALVTAWQWKGKTPKPLIKLRVEELLGEREWAREDEWEALGLALWAFKHKGDYDAY